MELQDRPILFTRKDWLNVYHNTYLQDLIRTEINIRRLEKLPPGDIVRQEMRKMDIGKGQMMQMPKEIKVKDQLTLERKANESLGQLLKVVKEMIAEEK